MRGKSDRGGGEFCALTPTANALVAGLPRAHRDIPLAHAHNSQKFRFSAAVPARGTWEGTCCEEVAGRGRLTRSSAGAAIQLQVCAAPGGPGCRPSRQLERSAFVSLRGTLFAAAAAASVIYSPGRLFCAQLPPLLLKLLLLFGSDQRLHREGVRLKA